MNKPIRRVVFTPYLKGAGPRFTLSLYETDSQTSSHTHVRFRFTSLGKLLFDDVIGVPMHQTIDGDAAVRAAMSFITLRPGDTDADHFEHYTAEQHEFCANHAEVLSCLVADRFGED